MLGLLLNRTRRDDLGASAVEYGLLIAGVTALIVLIVFASGGVVSNLFTDSCGTIANTALHTCGGGLSNTP